MSILIVDDDIKLNDMLAEIFSLEGFETVSAFNGEEAIDILSSKKDIELVLLDVMMPELDGWDALEYIKRHYEVKVVMLTALSEEFDEVKGLRSGADDYIAKPFRRNVLIERVKKLLDIRAVQQSVVYRSSNIELRVGERKVLIDGKAINMTTKEFSLLLMFFRNPGMVLTREMILDKIWGYEYFGNDRTIDTHVKMLRHSLGDYGDLIRTVRGLGYSFEGEVTEE